MAKDFTSNINNSTPNIDGNQISQTYEERQASKNQTAGNVKIQINNDPAESQINDTPVTQPLNNKKTKKEVKRSRISLYMDKDLYDRVSLFASLNRTNMNQLILCILQSFFIHKKFFIQLLTRT